MRFPLRFLVRIEEKKIIKDTIAAIATAMSHSGIGVVRMSGPQSFEIIDKIFQPKKAG